MSNPEASTDGAGACERSYGATGSSVGSSACVAVAAICSQRCTCSHSRRLDARVLDDFVSLFFYFFLLDNFVSRFHYFFIFFCLTTSSHYFLARNAALRCPVFFSSMAYSFYQWLILAINFFFLYSFQCWDSTSDGVCDRVDFYR